MRLTSFAFEQCVIYPTKEHNSTDSRLCSGAQCSKVLSYNLILGEGFLVSSPSGFSMLYGQQLVFASSYSEIVLGCSSVPGSFLLL